MTTHIEWDWGKPDKPDEGIYLPRDKHSSSGYHIIINGERYATSIDRLEGHCWFSADEQKQPLVIKTYDRAVELANASKRRWPHAVFDVRPVE